MRNASGFSSLEAKNVSAPGHAEPAISLAEHTSPAPRATASQRSTMSLRRVAMIAISSICSAALREVANNNVEFGVGDPEPGVHRLRRTADHLAWASGNIAHQVLVLLFEHSARVCAHTDKELANFWIREQPVCEVVDDCRDAVVAAEPFIERALRLAASRLRLAGSR